MRTKLLLKYISVVLDFSAMFSNRVASSVYAYIPIHIHPYTHKKNACINADMDELLNKFASQSCNPRWYREQSGF